MGKQFSYCFEPNKISLHGSLERSTLEDLLQQQRDAYTWYGQWSSMRAWESLGSWMKTLLDVTTHKNPQRSIHRSEQILLAGKSECPHLMDSSSACSHPFFVDIEALENIDASGWAALIHLLHYMSDFKNNVQLTGIISSHRKLIRLYQLESFLKPYLSEPHLLEP